MFFNTFKKIIKITRTEIGTRYTFQPISNLAPPTAIPLTSSLRARC